MFRRRALEAFQLPELVATWRSLARQAAARGDRDAAVRFDRLADQLAPAVSEDPEAIFPSPRTINMQMPHKPPPPPPKPQKRGYVPHPDRPPPGRRPAPP